LKVHKSWRHPDPGQLPHVQPGSHYKAASKVSTKQRPTDRTNAPIVFQPTAIKKRKAPDLLIDTTNIKNSKNWENTDLDLADIDELEVVKKLVSLGNAEQSLTESPTQDDTPSPSSQPLPTQAEIPVTSIPPTKALEYHTQQVTDSDKRLTNWRDPSQDTMDKIARAISQRMYLVSKSEKSSLEKHFLVLERLGSGCVVAVRSTPTCTCSDFENGGLCKHMLFVYLKVLRVPPESELIHQTTLLNSELHDIFSKAPSPTHQPQNQGDGPGEVKRKPVQGLCPICYEDLSGSEAVVWCELGCGNNVHASCFEHLGLTKVAIGEELTCVYCGEAWKKFTAPTKLPNRGLSGHNDIFFCWAPASPSISD
jgi:hypothetical protein